jgi:ferredoxin-NADP reductase
VDSLTVGGSGGGRLRVQGPTGFVLYEGRGQFNIHTVAVQVRRINLIGGGTGITPLWQLMRAILALGGAEERRAAVQVSLVFANSTPRDILLREKIEQLARSQPQRCRVCFVVSRLEDAEQHKGLAQPSASSPPVNQQQQQQQQQQHPPSEKPTPQAASPPNVCVASGRISALLFRHHLHPPSSDTLTFVCGPPPMVQAAYQHLFQLAFRDEQIVEF